MFKAIVYSLYFIFAILLNSVGILIQRSINLYGVSHSQAGNLEGFKDISIAVVSFFAGMMLPKLGYKKGLIFGLLLVLSGCINMYFANSFWAVKILFACVGISFALVKVAVYALVSSYSTSNESLNKFLSTVESVFMVGIATAYIVFPLFYSDQHPDKWLNIYLLLSVLTVAVIIMVLFQDFGQYEFYDVGTKVSGINTQAKIVSQPLVLIFALCAFFYVMTEQGIMSWLPTFNEKVLNLPEKLSVNMAVILALSIALGRLVAGRLGQLVPWIRILLFCLAVAFLMIVFILPLTGKIQPGEIKGFGDIPLIAFIFPLIGLFLAPIYPLMNAAVLAVTDKDKLTQMAGILTFFSALGGTLGSKITGVLFEKIGGANAFYFGLIPLFLLSIFLYLLHMKTNYGAKDFQSQN